MKGIGMLIVALRVKHVLTLIALESGLPCLKASASYPEPVQSGCSVAACFSLIFMLSVCFPCSILAFL